MLVKEELLDKSELKLSVFNINGREVANLADAIFDAKG